VAWSVVARVDKMISDAKPWDLAKDGNQREILSAVLYRAAESLRWLCVLLYPLMPESAQGIYGQLGLGGSSGSPNAKISLAAIDPAELRWGGLQEGTRIGEVKPLFPRIDKGRVMSEIKTDRSSGTHIPEADAVPGLPTATETQPSLAMKHATEADAVPGQAEMLSTLNARREEELAIEGLIDITDFTKVELRVGEILTAERIPKADKLLLLSVDIGEEKPRQILAGIALHYEPDKLIGRKIAVVSNLKPRKMRGYESQGMLLAASVGEEGKPVLATFTEEVPNGARLK
ncbi:MAG: methionine--tRNA ligase subunit beta, partial [Acidobacteria bacterium]|nr:methionine--tRNA ligase subunit beta [Acidobacteriota bacterium]